MWVTFGRGGGSACPPFDPYNTAAGPIHASVALGAES
jgi:hypothetical protein